MRPADHIYNDHEVYQISFPGGTGGNFIAMLFYNFLNGGPYTKEFPEFGHAHFENRQQWMFNWEWKHHHDPTKDWHDLFSYDHIAPRDLNKPLVLIDHMIPDWDRLLTFYPNCKSLIITITMDCMPRVAANVIWKNLLAPWWENREGFNPQSWEDFKSFNPVVLKEVVTPDDLTLEHMEAILNPRSKHSHILHQYFLKFEEYRNPPLHPRVFPLPVYDIYNNKNRTLKIISQMTRRPITQDISDVYDAYLIAQEKLINTRMPWVKV